jgi:hypothetical protein
VPYYNKKYNLKDYTDFSNRISSTLQSDNDNNVELSLHGLYHQVDGQFDDFDTHTKEEEKNEVQKGLDILSSANLPKPLIFIPPAWHLSTHFIVGYASIFFILQVFLFILLIYKWAAVSSNLIFFINEKGLLFFIFIMFLSYCF